MRRYLHDGDSRRLTTKTTNSKLKLPGIWLPVDFYISCSGTQKRTLHVPERVVDVWAESRGVKQKVNGPEGALC